MLLFLVVPLISFGGDDYETVASRAAATFGIGEDEFTIEFTNDLRNSQGQSVAGLYLGIEVINDRKVHRIKVQRHFLRVITVGTIFHEMAHAAQFHHGLCPGEFNLEQHAEILAFHAMQQSGFWWYSLHMLSFHTFHLKPTQYIATAQMWSMTTGNWDFEANALNISFFNF